ncbi:hypothetical protein JB92DRAFT_2677543, partial [Gautieria morchelliformis]
DERREEIYKWLSAPEHLSKHRNARKKRQETTGLWFVQGEQFEEWKESPRSFLWLHGIPGAGKTVLCSTIIEEISLHCQSDPSLAVAFFYFDFNNKDTQPDAVLRSLVVQLSLQCASTPSALAALFSRSADGRRSPSPEELMSTLKVLVEGFQIVYIVFDALDECSERNTFLTLLREVVSWGLGSLHLLVTSRKERDIEETLSSLVSHQVHMDDSLVDGDIQIHVSRTLGDDIKFSLCSAGEKEKIKTTLIEGAHGMFRWVVCQLDALRKCRSPAALEKALTRLPTTLYETYDRILTDIDEDYRKDALSLLQWLAFSVGTSSLNEALDVLATEPDAEDGSLFDRSRRLWDPRDILTICSSLVAITDPDAKLHEEDSIEHHAADVDEPGEVRLAHFSVREYLISEHLRNDVTLSRFHFNQKVAEIFIAQTCLAYLLQFDQPGSVDSSTGTSYPLCHYAAEHWMDHARADAAGSSDTLHRLTMNLLEPSDPAYTNWLWLCRQNLSWESYYVSPLYYTSLAGLERATQSLLMNGSDVNGRGGNKGSALQAAALKGHATVVGLLLKMGADINAQA